MQSSASIGHAKATQYALASSSPSPLSPPLKRRSWCRRHPTLALLLLFIVVFFLGFALYAVASLSEVRQQVTVIQNLLTLVMGHSLIRSIVLSHHYLTCLLHTARFARALRYAPSLARSVSRSRVRGTVE